MKLEQAIASVALVALSAGLIVSCWLLVRLGRRTAGSAALVRSRFWGVATLLVLVCLPGLYATAVWGQLLTEGPVRFTRAWLAWLPTAAGTMAWTCTFLLAPKDVGVARQVRDATLVVAALLAALAVCGLQVVAPLKRTAAVVAIDQSRSMELVANVEDRIRKELQAARTSMSADDRMSTLVFGANAVVRTPLLGKDQQGTAALTPVVRSATDIERALRRALAEIPADATGRLVLLSDGVATRGDVSAGVAAAAAAGLQIDVVPLDQSELSNVRLVKLNAPATVAQGESYAIRVILESRAATELTLEVLEDERLLRRGSVHLQAGQTALSLKQTADFPGLHKLDVRIAGAPEALDALLEDNQLAAFVRVRGRSRALVISEGPSPLASVLDEGGFVVDRVRPAAAPASLDRIALADLVAIDDVAADQLSDAQMRAIATYVRSLGGGLLLLGSPRTMGPGGYSRSPIEAVSPVSFDLKQDRHRGSLAEVLVIDYSGSMSATTGDSTKLDLANEGAVRSMSLLGRGDQLGVMHVDTEPSWTVSLGEIQNMRAVAAQIRNVGPGGGGILVDPALRAAYAALREREAALKHVVLFADGADAEGMVDAVALTANAQRQKITTSVVALGAGDDLAKLENLSRVGAGRFYLVSDATRLPAVFARETVTAARAAIRDEPFRVVARGTHPPLRGVDVDTAPELGGYIVTLPKPRTVTLLEGPEGDPILATWSTGLGRTGAFTSNFGGEWGKSWLQWPGAAQLFIQLARSLARNDTDSQIRLDANVNDGQLLIAVDAIDADGSLDNFRSLAALIATPEGDVSQVALRPNGPGRYGTSLGLSEPGAYLISVQDSSTQTLLATTGVELSAGDELKPTGTDHATLRRIAVDSGGKVRETLAGFFQEPIERRFIHVSVDRTLAWLAAALLLASVAARRVRIPRAWLPAKTDVSTAGVTIRPKTNANASPADHAKNRPRSTAELLLERRRRREADEGSG